MILDTSAIVAAISAEADGQRFQAAMKSADTLAMASITALETRIVLYARYGSEAALAFDRLLEGLVIVVVPFDDELARAAFDCFRRYGKGQGHKAQLNIIDCAAYALSKARDEPLLFKGDDFARTDVQAAA